MGIEPVSIAWVELLRVLKKAMIGHIKLRCKWALFWISGIVGACQYLAARRKPRKGLTILCYHRIADGLPSNPPFDPYNVHPETFARQVELCMKMKGVTVVSASEVREWIVSGRMPSGSYLLFTFDDGYENVLTAAAMLQQGGFPGVVFVATEFLDKATFTHNPYDLWVGSMKSSEPSWSRPLTLNECKMLLRMGMEIQPHSHTHQNMRNLTSNELEYEIAMSKQVIREIGEDPHIAFAYPGGSTLEAVSSQVESALKESGTSFAVCTDAGNNPWDVLLRRRFRLKRLPVQHFETSLLFEAKAGGYEGIMPLLKMLSYTASRFVMRLESVMKKL